VVKIRAAASQAGIANILSKGRRHPPAAIISPWSLPTIQANRVRFPHRSVATMVISERCQAGQADALDSAPAEPKRVSDTVIPEGQTEGQTCDSGLVPAPAPKPLTEPADRLADYLLGPTVFCA
jgi:hypothetical protein